MAETVYLNDGSIEAVFTDKQIFLENLIKEKMGDDVLHFFLGFMADINEGTHYYQEAIREKEMIVDRYHALCTDAKDQFLEITELLKATRLNRKSLFAVAEKGYNDIFNNL